MGINMFAKVVRQTAKDYCIITHIFKITHHLIRREIYETREDKEITESGKKVDNSNNYNNNNNNIFKMSKTAPNGHKLLNC